MSEKENVYYVYALIEPIGLDNPIHFSYKGQEDLFLSVKPYYIGKGKGFRLLDHKKEADKYSLRDLKEKNIRVNKHKIRKIKKLGIFSHIVLFNNLLEDVAFDIEKQLIDLIGLENLTNIRGGGEGGSCGEEVKKQLSEARKGKSWEDRFGKEKATKAKKRASLLNSGKRNNMWGRTDQVYTKGGLYEHSTKIKKGKKWEDWLGEDRAFKLKQERSKKYSGINNPNCKYNYNFMEIFTWFFDNRDIDEYCKLRELDRYSLQRLLKKIDINWNKYSIRRPKDYEKTLKQSAYWKNKKHALYKKALYKNLITKEQYNELLIKNERH